MNIGPRGDGVIDEADQKILRGIGAWMQKNSASIYGCDRTPLPVQNWGTSTRKGRTLYLHVFRWPKDGNPLVAGWQSDPSAVRILAGSPAIRPIRRIGPNDLEISVPTVASDQVDSVIALEFSGEI